MDTSIDEMETEDDDELVDVCSPLQTGTDLIYS